MFVCYSVNHDTVCDANCDDTASVLRHSNAIVISCANTRFVVLVIVVAVAVAVVVSLIVETAAAAV